MARDKVLYDGHAVAAVAATSRSDRRAGAGADRGRVRGAAARHRRRGGDGSRTRRCCTTTCSRRASSPSRASRPTSPSGSSSRIGDVAAGFAEADVIVEGSYTTQPVHQGYIEPHACVARCRRRRPGGDLELEPGPLHGPRLTCAKLLSMDMSTSACTPAEIGGGFGGKTIVYLEPLALALSRKSGRPVKMVMTREEVFRATGPTSGAVDRGQDRRQEGRHDRRRRGGAEVPGRRLPRLAGEPAPSMCAFARYDIAERACRRLRRGLQPAEGRGLPRARRADLGLRASRACIDELAGKLDMDPIEAAAEERREGGHQGRLRPEASRTSATSRRWRRRATHPHYKAPLGPNQGRGVASGFWFNIGGESSAAGARRTRTARVVVTLRQPRTSAARAPRWR